MKKIYIVFIFMLLAAMYLPACIPANSAPDCKSADVFCVGMVTDVGKVNDESSNQFAWDGIKQAEKDLGVYAQYIETTDWKDYEKNIATFGEAGFDVIVTVGFNLSDVTAKAAITYPNAMFIGVDQFQDASKPVPANLVGLNFPDDQAGFLVGALAAQMTKSGKIGAVCSTDIVPSTWRYGEGYKAGAAYIDPSVEVTVVYHNDVNSNQAFSDPEWGAVSASGMIGKGVDVVFGAGGRTGNGAVTAAAQMGAYAIAADSDQYNTLPDAQKMLLSSAIKFITPGVFDLVKLARDDKFPSGNYFGSAGYAPFHDLNNQVPAKVKARMKEIAQGLIDGSIKTNVSSVKP